MVPKHDLNTYNYYLQMIRDVTGLNEARDGTLPDRDTLVGLQKLAAQASNIATKHITNASLYLTLKFEDFGFMNLIIFDFTLNVFIKTFTS